MSQSFRPVKEVWNAHSSCFVEPEELIVLLHDLAARVGTASAEHEYGDKKAVWFEDGKKVLSNSLPMTGWISVVIGTLVLLCRLGLSCAL